MSDELAVFADALELAPCDGESSRFLIAMRVEGALDICWSLGPAEAMQYAHMLREWACGADASMRDWTPRKPLGLPGE